MGSLPDSAQTMLLSKKFTGHTLIQLSKSANAQLSIDDVKGNSHWLKGVLLSVNDKVPSTFYLADGFMQLDLDLGVQRPANFIRCP
jgi:hypothetical protein